MATLEQMKVRITRLLKEGKCVQCAQPKTNPERRCKVCLEIDQSAQKIRQLTKHLRRKIVLDFELPRRKPAVAGIPLTAEELERIRNTSMSDFTVGSCRPV